MKIFSILLIIWFSGCAVDSDQDSRIKPKSTNSSTTASSVDSRSDGSASDRDFVARDMEDDLQLASSSSTSPSSENKSVGQTNPAIIAWPTINWKRSLPIGSRDDSGLLMGGTELRALQSFDGKLFASNGYWTDRHAGTDWLPGGQVFRLDKPISEGGKWVVDLHLEERMPKSVMRRFHTMAEMKAIRFERDQNGKALSRPVDLLLVSVWDRSTGLHIFTRDVSGPASWAKSTIVPDGGAVAPWHVRSFAMHRDSVTGADLVFAGTSGSPRVPRGIYSGTYDPTAPGKIRWKSSQEAWDRTPGAGDRVMSMTVANGKLYATVCGKLYERSDGADPKWLIKFRHWQDACPEGPGEWSYRGATTIDNSDGSQSIIVAMEGNSLLGRWDFTNGVRGVRELALVPFLMSGLQRSAIHYTIAAYNGFAEINTPDGRLMHFAGIEALVGQGLPNTWHGWQRGAWFVARSADAKFKLYHIAPDGDEGAMVAVRTMIQSPFPSEPFAIYAGGFDANHVENVNHNTAWLYRGEFAK